MAGLASSGEPCYLRVQQCCVAGCRQHSGLSFRQHSGLSCRQHSGLSCCSPPPPPVRWAYCIVATNPGSRVRSYHQLFTATSVGAGDLTGQGSHATRRGKLRPSDRQHRPGPDRLPRPRVRLSEPPHSDGTALQVCGLPQARAGVCHGRLDVGDRSTRPARQVLYIAFNLPTVYFTILTTGSGRLMVATVLG